MTNVTQVGNSSWSPELPIDVVGRIGVLQVRDESKPGAPSRVYELGVEISRGRGRFGMTKIVNIVARYILVNQTSRVLHCGQARSVGTDGSSRREQLSGHSSCLFQWPRADQVQRLQARCLFLFKHSLSMSHSIFFCGELSILIICFRVPRHLMQFISAFRYGLTMKRYRATGQLVLTSASQEHFT